MEWDHESLGKYVPILDPPHNSEEISPLSIEFEIGAWHVSRVVKRVIQTANPRPSADYLRWWYLTRKRFLALNDTFHHRPPEEIPIEAAHREAASPPPRSQVPNVPDNNRVERRKMVGARTTA
ncbi:hypothetical protein PIB30_067786 [Stylosanthes scabra]|uniref:Uncharacterized protein n=1 Tax=Stylosanthes scabra TaxID=79078 RepID=A0ABU6TNA5_9FABA|nr:hypothetical protein [Stylosanthes scabra]